MRCLRALNKILPSETRGVPTWSVGESERLEIDVVATHLSPPYPARRGTWCPHVDVHPERMLELGIDSHTGPMQGREAAELPATGVNDDQCPLFFQTSRTLISTHWRRRSRQTRRAEAYKRIDKVPSIPLQGTRRRKLKRKSRWIAGQR